MKYFHTSAIILLSLVSTNIYSAGTVNSSVILNKSNIQNSTNTSTGSFGDAEANQGSTIIKGASLNNSTIVNNATVRNSANVAIGGEANQGSIKISRSLNGVTIVNKANINNSTNVAVDVLGTGSLFGTKESQQGSIIFK